MPQKHDNYTRKVFDGIGEGWGGEGKSDYKDCFRSQKKALLWNFDLVINLLAVSAIVRSKVFMHIWLIIRAKN